MKRTDEEALKSPEQERCGTKDFQTGKRVKRYTLEGTIWNSKVSLLVASSISSVQALQW